MSYCLNPKCPSPQNTRLAESCQACGSNLLLAKRYRALKPLGQGGFAVTYLAVDESYELKPRCVIKLFYPQTLSSDLKKKSRQLFVQEAKRLRSLDHPQIPAFLNYVEEGGNYYLIQEFISGPNLAQSLFKEGCFNEEEVRDLLTSLLLVLEFIHDNHVIHRDLKPENIIWNETSQLWTLVDFGAARLVTGTFLAQTGTVIGSAEFIAPEQAMGKATFASDLYSLGLICVHLLTNIRPFDLFDVGEGSWVWHRYLQAPVSQRFMNILNRLLERASNRRYQTASAVLADLNTLFFSDNKISLRLDPKGIPSQHQQKRILLKEAEGFSAFNANPSNLATASSDLMPQDPSQHTLKLLKSVLVSLFLIFIMPLMGFISVELMVQKDRGVQEDLSALEDPGVQEDLGVWIPSASTSASTFAISLDGKLAAVASETEVQVVDLSTTEIKQVFSNSFGIDSFLFAPDNQLIMWHEYNPYKQVFHDTGLEIRSLIDSRSVIVPRTPEPGAPYYKVYPSLDGTRIITQSLSQVSLIDNSGQLIKELPISKTDLLHQIAMSPDSDYIATVGYWDKVGPGGAVWMHSSETRQKGLLNAREVFKEIEVAPSDQIQIWDQKTGDLLKVLQSETGVGYPAFTSQGQLITTHPKGYLELWNLKTDQVQKIVLDPDSSDLAEVELTAVSPNGQFVSIVKGETQVWDLTTQKLRFTKPYFDKVLFSSDSRYFAVSSGNDVSVVEISTGKSQNFYTFDRENPKGFASSSYQVDQKALDLLDFLESTTGVVYPAFISQGRLITTHPKGYLELWNPKTDQVQKIVLDPDSSDLAEVELTAVSPNGQFVSIVKGETQVWDLTTQKLRLTKPYSEKVVFSPDSRYFAVDSGNGVSVVEISTGKSQDFSTSKFDRDKEVAFSPDSQSLILLDSGGIHRHLLTP